VASSFTAPQGISAARCGATPEAPGNGGPAGQKPAEPAAVRPARPARDLGTGPGAGDNRRDAAEDHLVAPMI
jgi:hypothetical protein